MSIGEARMILRRPHRLAQTGSFTVTALNIARNRIIEM